MDGVDGAGEGLAARAAGRVETTVMASETVVLDVQMNRTRGIRTMENLPSMDDRPAALRNPEGIAGCYWISAIGSGAEVWRFDGEGMVFVPGVEVPRYTWDSPPDSTYLRVEMGDPLNGPGHLTITLGPAPNWRLGMSCAANIKSRRG